MNPRKINRISVLLLAVGLGAALVIFLTAKPVVVNSLMAGMLTSKKYLYEMRRLGGNGNVLAAEFISWFKKLWQGQELAGTVAVLTVLGTLGFRFVAARPDLYSEVPMPEGKSPPRIPNE